MRKQILYFLIFIIIIFLYFLLKNKKERFVGHTKRYSNIGSSPYLSENDFYTNTTKLSDFKSVYDAKQPIFNPDLQNIPNNQNSYKAWKDGPVSHNNEYYQTIPIKNDLLKLPYYSEFQDNSYRLGFIKYMEIIKTLYDQINKNDININFKKININKVQIDNINNKTWKNRWHEYDPNIKKDFKYIESDIKPINILNKLFQKKINDNQTMIMNNDYLIKYGILKFDILIYKIHNIYKNQDNLIKYGILIAFFREQDLYIPLFYYEGLIKDNKAYIVHIDIVGYYATDTLLLATGTEDIIVYDEKKQYNFYILNSKLVKENDLKKDIISKNIFNLINIRQKYLDKFKLENNYACFNVDQRLQHTDRQDSNNILLYLNRYDCEAQYNWYGNKKSVGVWDAPCKKNSDCSFYRLNKNYPNDYGKCLINGYCELPLDMINLGYRYYFDESIYKPLCYNCKTTAWNPLTDLFPCCDEQYDKKKYPFLNGPDYAFQHDFRNRLNYYQQNNYKNEKLFNK